MGGGPGSEGESESRHREQAGPDMAAHLLAFPPEPQGRRERRWRPRSEPSFPEKPLSLFVLPLPGPPTLGCSFPALGQRASAGQRRGQGRTEKGPEQDKEEIPAFSLPLSFRGWGTQRKPQPF